MIYQKNNAQNRKDFYAPQDPITALQRAHERVAESCFSEKEREKLIEEVTQRVLERLSVSVDVAQAAKEIEELKNQLESVFSILTKGGY